MPLDYYIISETPTERKYIEANTASAAMLRWFDVFRSWADPQEIDNYNNVVKNWRDTDRRNWFESIVEPITAAIFNNMRGYAFQDVNNEYRDVLPAYVTRQAAFTRYGWVFVPDGVTDPRSGETLFPEEEEPEPSWDGGNGDEGEITEEPSLLSSLAKWGLIVASGAATWYVAHRVSSRYF